MKRNIFVILTIGILVGSAVNIFAGAGISNNSKLMGKVNIGLLSFTGDTSKIDQNSIRNAMAERLNSKGFLAANVSPNQAENRRFQYFIGVEIKRSGKSEFTATITLYGKDMDVIKQSSISRGGIPDDGIRPMVLKGLDEISWKIPTDRP